MRLILMRHAKSAWDDPKQEDFDRPLNARGVASAAGIGAWLADKGYRPDEVFCSSARRTRQTWAGVAEELGLDPMQAHFEPRLYLASEDRILATLKKAKGDMVLLIGHNPGIGYAAEGLAAQRADHPGFLRYPTAATTVYEVGAQNWAGLRPGSNRIVDFVVPRDLPPV